MKKTKMEIIWRDPETNIKIKSVELPMDAGKREKLMKELMRQQMGKMKIEIK